MPKHAVAWITHPACMLHEMDPDHPESPRRLSAIQDRMLSSGLSQVFLHLEPRKAAREALMRVHSPELINFVLESELGWAGCLRVDPDTVLARHTAEAALYAAGAAVLGVETVLEDTAAFSFCAVRPPGHHAERDKAMGFCFFNNVAVGAAEALARGLSRVAILDFDVHYGNGTADIFRDDPRVLLCSTYQHPLYPYWEAEHGIEHLVDVALAPGDGGEAFRHGVDNHWRPALERHQPELILVSAGFDAHAGDPLANLNLRTEDYRWIGQWTHDRAAEHCAGRVVAMLEGGYALKALAQGVEAFVRPFATV